MSLSAAAVVAITCGLANALNRHFGLSRDFAIVPSATTLPEKPGEKIWSDASQEIVYAGSLFDWKGVDASDCCDALVARLQNYGDRW